MIIRIDDFPTGVRPLLPDLGELFEILDCFEERQMTFHLGIVPETVRHYLCNKDKRRLTRYKYLIPCQHGYDHCYDELSKKCIDNADPGNRHTIDIFNEFAGQSGGVVTMKISNGKQYLEDLFGRKVNHYIPVCNHVDRVLIDALQTNMFTNVFTIHGISVPGIQNIIADFCGTLEQLDRRRMNQFDRAPLNCIALHITWEWDYANQHGFEAWKQLFNERL